ncbi:MAG TPA: PD-(D/E)XK nuclease superfamily protein [Candidatus Acidoferrales bacterium]|nr:PD-(D/E)XK nuclease superfamily protein [Candidatus Acidoferrales bacterium]
MPGGRNAVTSGDELAKAICELGRTLGLEVREQFKLARRLWGAERRIDVVLKDPKTSKTLGVECKFQGVGGTAEEKIPATVLDLAAWPIQGLVVFSGPGFTQNMKSYLISTGKAVELTDLEPWLRLYFGLSLEAE